MVRVVGEEWARGGAGLVFAFVSGEGGENNDLLGFLPCVPTTMPGCLYQSALARI